MNDKELVALDLTGQRELVRDKKLLASDVLAAQNKMISQYEPSINAFIAQASEKQISDQCCAIQDTSNVDSKLICGLSLAIKDNIDVEGFATTAGFETRKDCMAQVDAPVINLLKKAGAVINGKLNMHEGALGATNQNLYFGDCHNPLRHGFTPGGSSGGSAAAVAAGFCSAALGTDTMGSVRIPASYCGLFACKPSKGAVSNRGSVTCSRELDNIGPIARSARDLTLLMRIMAQYDPLSAQSVSFSFPNRGSSASSGTILIPNDMTFLGVDESIIDDFYDNIKRFEKMGFTLKEFNFEQYDFASARRAGLLICEADMRAEHADDWLNKQALFSPYMRSMLSFIDRKSAIDLIHAERQLDQAKVYAQQLFQQADYILMPTTPQRAFAFSDKVPANQADLTSLANQAGLPSVSMPMLSSADLPAGMQIVGPSGSDFMLLNIVEKWQQESGFTYRLPLI
jgi:aspartyl-tRNA(Asn)/glutamyl-tRNA(Gln) amidotransferase subunit A